MFVLDNKVFEWAGISEIELLQEIALALYQKGRLTFGQAAQTANMNYAEFQFFLGRNRVPIHYDVKDLMEDLETIKTISRKHGSN
jgi:predicted HTH domain antitoxin